MSAEDTGYTEAFLRLECLDRARIIDEQVRETEWIHRHAVERRLPASTEQLLRTADVIADFVLHGRLPAAAAADEHAR